jgi:hypothetical protein
MTRVIDEFAPPAPDPDGGRVYRRLMTSLEEAPGGLASGEQMLALRGSERRVQRDAEFFPGDPVGQVLLVGSR